MDRKKSLPAGIRRHLNETVLLTAVLSVVIILLAGLTIAATQVMAGVRAYTSGESMWAKGQKDAAYYLTEYAETGDARDWREYEKNIRIPLGDRRGRLALDNPALDSKAQYRVAFEGFLQGGNHPEDIPMMIFLYRWFSWEPHFAEAIQTWREGDSYILELVEIGNIIRTEHLSGAPDRERLENLVRRIHDIDFDVRKLEVRFSRKMGEASRWVQGSLIIFVTGTSLLLLAIGAWVNRRITAQRFEAESRYRAAFEQAAMGMAQVSLDLKWMDVNEKLCRILGYSREELLEKEIGQFTHPEDVNDSLSILNRMLAGSFDETNFEKRYRRANGEVIWCNLNVRLLHDIKGNPLHFVTVLEDVTEARRLTRELSHQASHDALTDLINRYEFERRVRHSIRRAQLEHVSNAICFIDLDQFKIVNDTCGHGAGDALLKQLGGVLRSCIRSNDTLARLGGDEFGLLLEACPPESAEKIAEKVRAAIRGVRFHWEGQTFTIGASIGLVPFDGDAQGISALMSSADAACFAAKEAGRNRVHVSDRDDPHVGRHMLAMQWQQRLQSALEKDRFFLVWQPIQRLSSDGEIRDFEVLLRLRDEEGNVVAPGSFLPAAERFGLIREIDHWVLEKVIAWLAENQADADQLDRISINLSGVTMSEPGFKDHVIALLEQHRISAEKLCFEVTETATITHLDIAKDLMESLRARGCHFALDDFGMGVSSFAYLNSLPVDCIKIDGTFVRDMESNEVHAAMVRSINDIAHTMGKETVAEFVENIGLLKTLREIGVDFAQGYGIGKPVDLGEFPNSSEKKNVSSG